MQTLPYRLKKVYKKQRGTFRAIHYLFYHLHLTPSFEH
ncbi:hypothetical protein PMAN_b0386 [Pseudoalteromonas marina]|nr:hypothetical protein PMAN_b0386 [Pseudoalteromonas marina]GAA75412.1 hypothetical protein P20480_1880 [Pseudoalteromonas sp. BSi20480]